MRETAGGEDDVCFYKEVALGGWSNRVWKWPPPPLCTPWYQRGGEEWPPPERVSSDLREPGFHCQQWVKGF